MNVVDSLDSLAEAAGYIKASNTDSMDHFGYSVALSADGNTLAVGAYLEGSSASGIDGNQADNSASSGAVYVFVRNDTGVWSQQAYVKASNTGLNDRFGDSVALSGDGNTLAVGAFWEDSDAAGIDGNQASNGAVDSGAVYVFVRDGVGVWSEQAYVKASNPDPDDWFGVRVALSGDGDTLAIGAFREDSNNIGGDQTNNFASESGAVYVFVRDSVVWSQQAYIKASNAGAGDQFGIDVALSADGDTLAVGAPYEDSSAIGIDGEQADDSVADSGAVYVFVRDATSTWSQQSYVKASNTDLDDWFGSSVALSGDGNTLTSGAIFESGGDEDNNSAPASGAAYVFERNGIDVWTQQAYIKAPSGSNGQFGWSIALSGDGNIFAAAARFEDSNATGIGGDEADTTATDSGAVYVYRRDGIGGWSRQAYVKASNTGSGDQFGYSVAVSSDGSLLAAGAIYEGSSAAGIGGNQVDDSAPVSGAVYLF